MLRSRLLRRVSLLLGSSLGVVDCVTYEYGALMTGYRVSGTTVDADSGEGIPGIQVESQGSTTTSKATGAWELFITDDIDCASRPCTVTGTDVDGLDNGSYADGQASYTASAGDTADEATDVLIELQPVEPDTGA